ncbi:MAG: hypothetical protein ACI9MR_000080 [Myxococcota bacterium]
MVIDFLVGYYSMTLGVEATVHHRENCQITKLLASLATVGLLASCGGPAPPLSPGPKIAHNILKGLPMMEPGPDRIDAAVSIAKASEPVGAINFSNLAEHILANEKATGEAYSHRVVVLQGTVNGRRPSDQYPMSSLEKRPSVEMLAHGVNRHLFFATSDTKRVAALSLGDGIRAKCLLLSSWIEPAGCVFAE